MLIEAPHRVDVDGPMIFLAGPISWGPDAWHERAIELLAKHDGLHIANPRRDPAASAQLWNLREDTAGAQFDDTAYDEQLDWETTYLRRAGARGVVLFWLARERTHNCARPHAQTTRFELAECKQRHSHEGARLVVGIEPGFTGARYIRRRFAQDCPGVPICDTLEATCLAAVALCAT
jgi:hypothetical protein